MVCVSQVLAVALQHVARLVEALHVVLREHARTRAVHARTDHLARFDHVAIREHIGRGGLRIARGRDAVGEVREIFPDLRLVDAPGRPDVRVHVDQPRHDRLAGDVDRSHACRCLQLTAAADLLDPVVLDQDVAVLDRFRPVHGQDPGAAQEHGAGRLRARRLDDHFHPSRLVRRFLSFRRLLFAGRLVGRRTFAGVLAFSCSAFRFSAS